MNREAERASLVRMLAARGITDARVLRAIAQVPREAFVPEELEPRAYVDAPLPIGRGQTISQPYVVALMCEAARTSPGKRVLEIGTGSGYGAAVLAELCGTVHTVERLPELADAAVLRLAALGYGNVHLHVGDGSLGWPDGAPYDAIVVTAGAPAVPEVLLAQLAIGGGLVVPVGPERLQRLVRITRTGETAYERDDLGGVTFVPLVGAAGWNGHARH